MSCHCGWRSARFIARGSKGYRLSGWYISEIERPEPSPSRKKHGSHSDKKTHREFHGQAISLLRKNIQRYELHQLPRLNKENVSTEDVEVYSDHIRTKTLNEDFELKFSDLLQMDIPRWIIDPLSFEVELAEPSRQEDMVDLQPARFWSKCIFERNSCIKFWSSFGRIKYPKLFAEAEQLLTAFPSSYLVEQGFSTVDYISSKSRNRLNVCDRGDLRLKLSSIEPNIKGLVSQHQPQGRHWYHSVTKITNATQTDYAVCKWAMTAILINIGLHVSFGI